MNVLTEAGEKAIELAPSRVARQKPSHEAEFCERRGLKVDTEAALIVLPGCSTKSDGYGISFQERMKKDGQKGAKKI